MNRVYGVRVKYKRSNSAKKSKLIRQMYRCYLPVEYAYQYYFKTNVLKTIHVACDKMKNKFSYAIINA